MVIAQQGRVFKAITLNTKSKKEKTLEEPTSPSGTQLLLARPSNLFMAANTLRSRYRTTVPYLHTSSHDPKLTQDEQITY